MDYFDNSVDVDLEISKNIRANAFSTLYELENYLGGYHSMLDTTQKSNNSVIKAWFCSNNLKRDGN